MPGDVPGEGTGQGPQGADGLQHDVGPHGDAERLRGQFAARRGAADGRIVGHLPFYHALQAVGFEPRVDQASGRRLTLFERGRQLYLDLIGATGGDLEAAVPPPTTGVGSDLETVATECGCAKCVTLDLQRHEERHDGDPEC